MITYRPWGFYKELDIDTNFKVKYLEIFPGESTSLQYHKYRNEFLYVVEGEVEIIMDDEPIIFGVRDHTYIPNKMPHRITNNTNSPAKVIEISTGPGPFSEEDIVRLEDNYNRV